MQHSVQKLFEHINIRPSVMKLRVRLKLITEYVSMYVLSV